MAIASHGIIGSMQPEYLARLGQDVQEFVKAVETAAGLDIEVVPDATLNLRGPLGLGKLKVDIESGSVRISAPTDGYFPDGGVRHEVLHVKRLYVDKVPRLSLAESVHLDPALEGALVVADNALEHLAIVPIELQHHPERLPHWEAVMARMWGAVLPNAPSELDRRIDACLHWSFLRHALPASPTIRIAEGFLHQHTLMAEAEDFATEVLASLASKEAVVRVFFNRFTEVQRGSCALEYLSSTAGSRFTAIPAN